MSAPVRRRARAAGFTLVELMVALAIGLSVVGALVAAWTASTRSGRQTDALAQLTDDATLALAVMRQQVAQAGFSSPHGGGAGGVLLPAFAAVRGCAARGFADLQATMAVADNCAPPGRGRDAPDALEVAYESSVQAGPGSNAILGGSSGREPLDCLGNSFAKTQDTAAGDYWLADSKFYVADGSLMCHGPGNAAGAAVVQNVETLQVRYGMASGAAGQAAYYDVAPAPGSPLWADVVAIRLCVQVRSAVRVLDASAAPTLGTWIDCADTARASTDGYLRRSFATTVALQDALP